MDKDPVHIVPMQSARYINIKASVVRTRLIPRFDTFCSENITVLRARLRKIA